MSKHGFGSPESNSTAQHGFSLVEMSVVLVVIAIIIGVVVEAKSIVGTAAADNIYVNFLQNWMASYNAFYAAQKIQPGDNPANPVGAVVGYGNSPQLCDLPGNPALSNVMLAAGISIPQGRQANDATDFVYLDANGIPHDLNVCFETVNWAIPASQVGAARIIVPKTVLDIRGITPALAVQLQTLVGDPFISGNLGRLRESTQAAGTGTAVAPWSASAGAVMSGTQDTGESVELEAYLLLQ